MKTKHTSTNVKPQYVSRNLHEKAAARRDALAHRCARQERRISNLNKQVIALKELAAALGDLQFHPRQDPAAVRRYNLARRAVA
jgi:anti-sigma factor RsiW